ncbi:MAG: response regulator transcription factor [Synergistaceae bacterium]|nr:response regulator transcription factor [Synergistaceae bacterium]
MTRIIIADDHDLFVEGMKELLARQPDIEFAGQAHDGIQAIEQASLLKPDIILMDIAMPRLNGIKASKQIRENFPDVKILMLSMHNNRELITESLKAGAMGYILKECSSEELFYAVSSVMNGQYYIAHSSLTILLDDYMRLLEEEKKSAPCQLSEREIEVLRLIAEGKNTKEIASDLMISKNTVDAHRRHIMDKTGCTSIAGLIRYAIREGY